MLERLLDNWGLKLLALALAFVIWVSVTGEMPIVRDYRVPLDIQLPESRVLTVTPPNTVTVRLRGHDNVLRRLDPAPLSVRVELSDLLVGERDVQIWEGDLVGVPRGVAVEFIEPDRLRLAVDEREQRGVPVEPVFLGQPPAGFAFYGARVRPQTVAVDGPRSEVDEIGVLRTDPIRLDERRQSFEARVGAVPRQPHVRVVDPRPVEVRVRIDAAPVSREFDGVRVEARGAQAPAQLSPSEVAVTVSGPPSVVERLVPAQLRAIADLAGLAPQPRPHHVSVVVAIDGVTDEDLAVLSSEVHGGGRVAARIGDRRDGE